MTDMTQEDGYDKIREQVKKLASHSMIGLRRNGVPHVNQPDVLMFELVARLEYVRPVWDTLEGVLRPSVCFHLRCEEIKNNSPERVAEMVENRFRESLLSMWEFLTEELHKSNMQILLKEEECPVEHTSAYSTSPAGAAPALTRP